MAYGTTRGALQGHGQVGILPVEQRSAGQLRWCRDPHSSSSLEAPTTESGLTRGHWQQGPGQTGQHSGLLRQPHLVWRPNNSSNLVFLKYYGCSHLIPSLEEKLNPSAPNSYQSLQERTGVQ